MSINPKQLNDPSIADLSAIPASGAKAYVFDENEHIELDRHKRVDLGTIRQVPAGGTTDQVLTKTASGYDWADAASGGITKGTTAERPASPTEGDLYLDTQTTQLLVWNGFVWIEVVNYLSEVNVQYLVIAGGGAGGSTSSGGGGAGGYRTNRAGDASGGGGTAEPELSLQILTNYTITVGAGGSKGSRVLESSGGNGSNSVFHNITAIGGGGGGGFTLNGLSGGSGGGGGYRNATGGLSTLFQGFDGGNAISSDTLLGSGGGGGAASVGGNSVSNNVSGNGGSALASTITGASVLRAGGGGGGANVGGTGGTGGGGGATNGVPNGDAADALANTGSGGGGGGRYQTGTSSFGLGGNGGSGVVILRYPDAYTITGGTGLTFSTATDGTDKVTTFTAGSGTIQFTL